MLYLTGFAQRGLYGQAYSVKENITITDLLYRVENVIKKEADVIRDQMRRNDVTLIGGEASFIDPHCLRIKGIKETVEVKADYIVVGTGTTPAKPKQVEACGHTVFTSDQLLHMTELPRTLTVVGAGVIGRETTDAIVLFTAQRTEIKIKRDRIEEMAVDKLSIMPQGLDRLLSKQELGDLVAYLKSLE